MHFHPREQAALREAGLSTEQLESVSAAVADAATEAAADLEAFFERDTVYSDMDRAHSTDAVHEHTVEYLDLFTHSADLRGYLRFDTWGVWVADGRRLSDAVVELTLGPTVHDRVRFAADPGEL
jgi:hypothetical protein